jgi:hypothetical protein
MEHKETLLQYLTQLALVVAIVSFVGWFYWRDASALRDIKTQLRATPTVDRVLVARAIGHLHGEIGEVALLIITGNLLLKVLAAGLGRLLGSSTNGHTDPSQEP